MRNQNTAPNICKEITITTTQNTTFIGDRFVGFGLGGVFVSARGGVYGFSSFLIMAASFARIAAGNRNFPTAISFGNHSVSLRDFRAEGALQVSPGQVSAANAAPGHGING
jgi:hypothetical protein